MAFFHTLCAINGLVVLVYGLGLIFAPDFFMGKFIYRKGVWLEFKSRVIMNPRDRKVYEHIMLGLGLTWLTWALLAYYTMYTSQEPPQRTKFASLNLLAWLWWTGLDSYIRTMGIYSRFAAKANMLITVGFCLAWGLEYFTTAY